MKRHEAATAGTAFAFLLAGAVACSGGGGGKVKTEIATALELHNRTADPTMHFESLPFQSGTALAPVVLHISGIKCENIREDDGTTEMKNTVGDQSFVSGDLQTYEQAGAKAVIAVAGPLCNWINDLKKFNTAIINGFDVYLTPETTDIGVQELLDVSATIPQISISTSAGLSGHDPDIDVLFVK